MYNGISAKPSTRPSAAKSTPSVKALKGFRGRAVLEIVAPYEGDTYRTVYTVRFRDVIYVLHAFQKKSKRGIRTPQNEIKLVNQRLAAAQRDYRERQMVG